MRTEPIIHDLKDRYSNQLSPERLQKQTNKSYYNSKSIRSALPSES